MPFDLDHWLKTEIVNYADVPPGSLRQDNYDHQWADFGRYLHDRAIHIDLVKAITTALLSWDADVKKKTLQVHIAERVRVYLWTGVIK
jgi:hypothetical protein